MAKKKVRRRSTWVTQNFLANTLRSRIVKGFYRPGDRFPTRDELELKYKASRITIQRAFDQLIAEGFARPRGRLGTFVTAAPPHLYKYALMIPVSEFGRMEHGSLTVALEKAARAINREGPQRIDIYSSISRQEDLEHLAKLQEDLRLKRLAGLIYVADSEGRLDQPVFEAPGMFKIAVSGRDVDPAMPRVELDRESFYQQAMLYLSSRGRRKIALVSTGYQWMTELGYLHKVMTDHPMLTEEHWLCPVDRQHPETAENLVNMMLKASGDTRPDAWILSDVSLVEPFQAAMRSNRMNPSQIDVIVGCYFPRQKSQEQCFCLLGYGAQDILETCFERIGHMRSKLDIPNVFRVSAGFKKPPKRKPTLELP